MVEQLRREAAIKRINVSQAIEDIKVVPLFGHRKNYIRDRTIASKTPFFYPSDFIDRRCTIRLRQANKVVYQIGKLESAFFFYLCFIQTLDLVVPCSKTTSSKLSSISASDLINFTNFLSFFLFRQKFISDHENEDYLLVGFPSQKSNPFREKSSCSVLWSFKVDDSYALQLFLASLLVDFNLIPTQRGEDSSLAVDTNTINIHFLVCIIIFCLFRMTNTNK